MIGSIIEAGFFTLVGIGLCAYYPALAPKVRERATAAYKAIRGS